MKKILKTTPLLTVILLFLAACGNGSSASQSDNTITVGSMEGIQADVLDVATGIAEENGINVEIITFSDYNTPNTALLDGSLDANIYQHTSFLDQFNNDHDADLASAGGAFLNPMAIYSENYTNMDEVEDGASFALPNDPSNMGRALYLLESADLIQIDEEATNPVISDVTENPHNIKFVELDPAQIPRQLSEVNFGAINTNYAVDFGLDPINDSIYREGNNSPYVVQIVTRPEDVENENIQTFVDAYQSEEVANAIEEISEGTMIPGWE